MRRLIFVGAAASSAGTSEESTSMDRDIRAVAAEAFVKRAGGNKNYALWTPIGDNKAYIRVSEGVVWFFNGGTDTLAIHHPKLGRTVIWKPADLDRYKSRVHGTENPVGVLLQIARKEHV